MLTHLYIKNFGLIEEETLALGQGLTVFTGETGAGKSMLIDALSLALGKRGGRGFVRPGATTAQIEATFKLPRTHVVYALLEELGIECEENTLYLRRQMLVDGQTKCFICGVRVNQNQMAEVGDTLVDIHGQRNQQFLLQPRYHSMLLDQLYCSKETTKRVEEAYKAWRTQVDKLQTLREKEQNRLREEELLTAYSTELEAFAPTLGEEETLTQERQNLLGLEKLLTTLQSVQTLMDETLPEETLSRAQRLLAVAPAQHEGFATLLDAFSTAATNAADAAHSLQQFSSLFEVDPQYLEQVDERLHKLKALARKHHCIADELPAKLATFKEELAQLAALEHTCHTLEKAVAAAWAVFKEACETLSKERQKGAEALALTLGAELKHLKLPHAAFQAQLTSLPEEEWTRQGAERVAFFVRFNVGAAFEALEKAASGGEVSRLMLALKVVLFASLPPQTLVFDEIDTGVGGAVADAMGKCLKALATQHQVFAITHLPQVAAQGKTHMFIAKQTVGEQTQTSVSELLSAAREEEIARMLSGAELTNAAKEAAKSLLQAHSA